MDRSGSVEERRETRRKLFLKKVKEDAEVKRWARKGGDEEMMRAVWKLENGRRERGLLLGLEREGGVEEEVSVEEMMAEDVEEWERGELEAMLEMREMGDEDGKMEGRNGGEQPYGSDDEEYDDIFMDLIQEEMWSSQQQSQQVLQAHPPPTNHDTTIEGHHQQADTSIDMDELMDMS